MKKSNQAAGSSKASSPKKSDREQLKPKPEEFTPGKPDKTGSLYYTVDLPVVVMHKLRNGEKPTLARLKGGQRIKGDWIKSVSLDRLVAVLDLPAMLYGHERGDARVGP